MTPPDEARDALARALRDGEPGTQVINMFADPFDDADADDVADAILSRFAASGWVVVPEGEVERLRAVERAAQSVLDNEDYGWHEAYVHLAALRAALIPALATEPDRETTP